MKATMIINKGKGKDFSGIMMLNDVKAKRR